MTQPSETHTRYVVTARHLGCGERFYLGSQTYLSRKTLLTLERDPVIVSERVAKSLAELAAVDESLVDVALDPVDAEATGLRPACAECGSERADIRNPGIIAEFGPDAVCCEVPVG